VGTVALTVFDTPSMTDTVFVVKKLDTYTVFVLALTATDHGLWPTGTVAMRPFVAPL
jgi:hypothetical protein